MSNFQSDINYFIEGIKAKDRRVLSKAITLAESNNPSHSDLINEILIRLEDYAIKCPVIGISGAPGVGKSTFIESFGCLLIDENKSVAVLSIDPSSEESGGSILGDKTRMGELSKRKNAYIRPSPSGKFLGGISLGTRRSIAVCKAFGFDYIIVETVGVGQSEFMAAHLADLFILLVTPHGGDELQSIKKGIMEKVDLFCINKSDLFNENEINLTKAFLKESRQNNDLGKAEIFSISSSYRNGFENLYKTINSKQINKKRDEKWWFIKENQFSLLVNKDSGRKSDNLFLLHLLKNEKITLEEALYINKELLA